MRILLLNQFFWPDSAATSQLLTDLANELVSRGQEVVVICGHSRYAIEDFSEGPPAAIVHRIRSLPFARGRVTRPLSYLSFLLGALPKGLRLGSVDLVITLTTPPMLSVVGNALKRRYRAKHYIWEMDVFPEALADVGLLAANSWLVRLIGWIADYCHRRSDGIIALGECMRGRLTARGIPAHKIQVAENWADGKHIFPLPHREDEALNVLYSGNLGLSHDVDTILFAMEALRSDSRLRFTFAGDGPRHKALQKYCAKHGIGNVSFRPYCRRDELSASYAEADVGLVTQRQTCLGSVVPSKVYGFLAAGRPVLFIGPREATPRQIIERFRCGWQIDCGDGPGLVMLLKELRADPRTVQSAGARGRDAFLAHYDLPQGVARICDIIGVPAHGAETLGASEAFSAI